MTTILIIRHGESTANLEEIYLGQGNRDLTEKGHLQAEKTAEILENEKIDAIYSSDLTRAVQTATHLANKKQMEIIQDAGIREINGGEWDFKKFTDLPLLYPDEYGKWLTDLGHARCVGGESFTEVQERMLQTITRIAEENEGKTIALFSHGTAIQAFISKIKNINLSRIREEQPYATNASVTTINYENGRFTILEHSRDDFLGDLITALPKTV